MVAVLANLEKELSKLKIGINEEFKKNVGQLAKTRGLGPIST